MLIQWNTQGLSLPRRYWAVLSSNTLAEKRIFPKFCSISAMAVSYSAISFFLFSILSRIESIWKSTFGSIWEGKNAFNTDIFRGDILCTFCKTAFSISRASIAAASLNWGAVNDYDYDHCVRSNRLLLSLLFSFCFLLKQSCKLAEYNSQTTATSIIDYKNSLFWITL